MPMAGAQYGLNPLLNDAAVIWKMTNTPIGRFRKNSANDRNPG
jgi:hypothetical protein